MKKNTFWILVGLLVLILAPVIGVLIIIMYRSDFSTCCLGVLLFVVGGIAGLVLLVKAIAQFIKSGQQRKAAEKGGIDLTPYESQETVTAMFFLEPVFTCAEAALRIIRNNRRSVSMLSGIILSALVISSVFIYTDALQQQIYNDW